MRCKSSNKPMVKHKKGLWSPDEDQKLTYYVMNHGHNCWSSVPINAGLQRNGKSCRLRWINYLRPGLKRGGFSLQEEETILTLHGLLGNKWSQISQHLPGRTDNEIKNHWHAHLKKRAAKLERLQNHPKVVDYETSDIKCKEASLSYLNTSNFTNSSSADMDQSVPPVSQISNLPKIQFADWISLDEFQQGFVNASGQPSINGLNYPLSKTEYERQYDEGSTENSEPRICQESGSNEAMQHTQMTIDEIFEFNNEDFYIDDFMYM